MSASEKPRKRLPVKPSIENLKKQAKRLAKLENHPLAEAQHRLAKEYGSRNWAELLHVVETMLRGSDQYANVSYELEALPKAAKAGDMESIRQILASGEYTQHDLDLALARSLCDVSLRAQADLLIEHGADVDGQYGSGYGPIVLVTGEGVDPGTLEYLIARGCDITFPPVDTKYGPASPMLSILGTYVRGRNEAKHRYIDILLEHGAHVPPELEPWFLAIHRGDVDALGKALERDPELLRRRFPAIPGNGNLNLDGCSLLHMAIEFGERECVDLLFDRGADINLRGDIVTHGEQTWGGHTPIFHAIQSWEGAHRELFEHIVKRAGQRIDMSVSATLRVFGELKGPFTPLEWAGNNESEAALLLPLDLTAKLKQAIRAERVAEVETILNAHPELLTPALWPDAIYQAKSLQITKLLLDRGLSPDECTAPRKPLHLAIYQCLPGIVDLLLEHGADPNLRNPLNERPLDLLDSYEPRPLGDPDSMQIRRSLLQAGAADDFFSAIRAGDLEAMRSMLDEDADVISAPSPDIGVPPLFVAARSGRLEAARLLIERGAEVNQANDKENSPLWFACQSCAKAEDRIAVADLLIEHGANVNARCEDGSTPLHFAAWRGPAEMVKLLLSKGARTWIEDDRGEKAVDYARNSKVNPEREATVSVLTEYQFPSEVFRAAVRALDSGAVEELARLVRENPQVVREKVENAEWIAGPYFTRPTLLHFVANNPNRSETMPPRILDSTVVILDAGAEIDARTEHSNGGTTLALVASSMPAHRSGVQIPLIRLLVQHGANPQEGVGAAVQERFPEALRTLLELGARHTLLSTAALGDIGQMRHLLSKDPSMETRVSAAQIAAIYGNQEVLALLMESGVDVNVRLPHPYSPTLLHQAAWYGHRSLVEWLLERGADASIRDTQFHGTPAGWAVTNKHADLAELIQKRAKEMKPGD